MSDPFANACTHSRYGGTILLDGKAVAETAQCVHCGDHFVMVKGSGVIRGWCQNCNGMVCGPKCQVCLPFEAWLEQVEGTRQPGSVTVSARG